MTATGDNWRPLAIGDDYSRLMNGIFGLDWNDIPEPDWSGMLCWSIRKALQNFERLAVKDNLIYTKPKPAGLRGG